MPSPRKLREIPEAGGLSYEGMIAIVKTLPDMLTSFQQHVDAQVSRIEGKLDEKYAHVNAKLDLIKSDSASKEDMKRLEKDLQNGFEKLREIEWKIAHEEKSAPDTKAEKAELERRLRELEREDSFQKGRFSVGEKIMFAVLGIVFAAAAAFFGLK